MNGIEYVKNEKTGKYEKRYDNFIKSYFDLIVVIRSKKRMLFPSTELKNCFKECNGYSYEHSFHSFRISEKINELLDPEDSIIIINAEHLNCSPIKNPWKYFANVQEPNPYMDIKWPVKKGESKLDVHATGSGFYLFYNNEKAKHPDGTIVHGTREQCLYWMFYYNGWTIPEDINV